MAKLTVISKNETISIDVDRDEEGWTSGWCGVCRQSITDRGHFEDTAEAIVQHVENHEARGEDE